MLNRLFWPGGTCSIDCATVYNYHRNEFIVNGKFDRANLQASCPCPEMAPRHEVKGLDGGSDNPASLLPAKAPGGVVSEAFPEPNRDWGPVADRLGEGPTSVIELKGEEPT